MDDRAKKREKKKKKNQLIFTFIFDPILKPQSARKWEGRCAGEIERSQEIKTRAA